MRKPITGGDIKNAIHTLFNLTVSTSVQSPEMGSAMLRNKTKILVAEDMETNQRIATEMLQLLNCKVDIAQNGCEAVELFESTDYDLIFMDCQMPVMDGYTAAQSIRRIEQEEQLQAIPIVALTAGFEKTDEKRCRDAGMNHYLTKPFSMAELSNVLQSYIGHSEVLPPSSRPKAAVPEDIKAEDGKTGDSSKDEVINFSAVENILEVERQTGKSILNTVFLGFTDQMNEKLRELQEDLSESDSERVYKTAHAIKSMSANIGAKRVQQLSADIEAASRLGSLNGLEAKVDEINLAYTQFAKFFRLEYPN